MAESVKLVSALAPTIGYDKASKVAHHAMSHDCTLKEAAPTLNAVGEADSDRLVDPRTMQAPNLKGK
ncbi:hypothetical protein [Asaia sp. As-1742]|uniref:hypothetical protein n=1 Tax=Asaia sp. As-1742 TaxID=2608325 RepID=UPI0019654BEA